MHVLLRVGGSIEEPAFEPVHVAPLGGRSYQVIFSPGLAYGIAADDEIEIQDDGTYVVTCRGRNLAVRVLSPTSLAEHAQSLTSQVQQVLGGRLDGQVSKGLAFTIPIAAGFKQVEATFEQFISRHPGTLWEYGNVYDENGNSLGWWQGEA